jgi:hypothetical protein
MLSSEANFREIPKPNSCDTCVNTTHWQDQGWSKCKVLAGDVLIPWSKMEWLTCDCWTPKHDPTERELVLAKLSPKDRKVLGI